MTINFDVVIETPEDSVDMKAGLESLQGVSDATRCISEAILTGNTPQRLSHKGKVRTALKRRFKGSYGQIFSLDIHDEKLKSRFNLIGKETFVELITYFISEALYKDSVQLSDKAQKVLDSLGDSADKVVKQLRKSSLENIHKISVYFDHDIKIRYRKNRLEQEVIAKFDSSTAKVLEAKESKDIIDLTVSITRLNINTGNGRFLIKGQNDTVAFGFGVNYSEVKIRAKKLFSENLNYNNGLKSEDWKYLKISASPITLKDGKVVKYIVKRITNDQ